MARKAPPRQMIPGGAGVLPVLAHLVSEGKATAAQRAELLAFLIDKR